MLKCWSIAVLASLLWGSGELRAGRPSCRIDPERIRSWSDYARLASRERPPPYALEYRKCGKTLIYVGARHTNDPRSGTFALVRAAFQARRVQFAIFEGFPESQGNSPAGLLAYAERVAGTPEDSERYLTVRTAAAAGAIFVGGEPTDAEILSAVRPFGISANDLLGYYILRQIEGWRREQRLSGPNDPRMDREIQTIARGFASSAGVGAETLSNVSRFDGWKDWYRSVNGLSYESGYRPEDAYPSEVSPRPTNRIADRVGDVRDRHITSLIARGLRVHDTVLVVYGASHNLIEGPALEAALGRPHDLRVGARRRGPDR